MTQVFVVQGNCGEYSDHREWIVCAYRSEAMARAHAVAAKEWKQQNVSWSNYGDDGLKNPFDDSFYGNHIDTDWTAYPVDIRSKLPSVRRPMVAAQS